MSDEQKLEVIERLLFLLSEREQEIALLYDQLGKLMSTDQLDAKTLRELAASQAEPTAQVEEIERRTVLVIDTNAIVRLRLANALIADQFKVLTVADGLEAIDCLRTSGFDLIIFDYYAQGVKPLDFLAVLRERMPETPVIVTMKPEDELRHRAELSRAGAMSVLVKPVNMTVLEHSIRDLVRTNIQN